MSRNIKRRLRDMEQRIGPETDPLKGVIIYDPEEGADKAAERFFRENPGYEGPVYLIPDNGRDRHDPQR
jgi:hypothetical protein